MASTLLSNASNSSAHLKMPQVFVVPPEEDDTPAWCCFDANMPPSAASATDSPHHVLDMLQEESGATFLHYDLKEPRSLLDTIPMPKRNGDHETRSIMDVLMNDDYMELDNEMALDTEEIEQYLDLETDVGNDSEVVEVVKVRRYMADVEEQLRISTPPTYTSKSLRDRASGVFRSLKNAGKGSLRSRPKAQVILPPANEGARAKTPISHHSSAAFSQLFSPSTTLHSSPSVSSFDLVEVPSIPPLKEPKYPLSLRKVSLSSAQPSPPPGRLASSSTTSFNSRSPLPTSSTQPTSNRRHFSMTTLNRIFSFSRSDEVSDAVPVSRSHDSLGPSTESFSEPETPTEESTSLTPGHTLHPGQKRLPTGSTTLEEGDISFEMRLDSLHFDSLSFDVDRF